MNIAYRFRIYPTEEQKILLGKTFGCCRFLYNQMLNDKIREYEKTKKMLKNTPAMYKKEYPFLKEVDSLALANVQLHLEKAYKKFFREPKIGFPRFKSKHHSRNSYTTNVVNGNILVESKRIRLPKLKWIAMKKHREPAEGLRLKSVTVSMESSGKYFASLLYEGYSCENQAAEPDYSTAKILGIDYAMQGMAVFSDGKLDYAICAALAVFFSELQSKLFVSGSGVMSPSFYWGFLAENKSLVGVIGYLAEISGFFFVGLVVTVVFLKRKERAVLFGFLLPLVFAFLVSLTPLPSNSTSSDIPLIFFVMASDTSKIF